VIPDGVGRAIGITFDNIPLSEPIRRCRRAGRDSSPPLKARSHHWRKSVPIVTPQFFECHPRVGCRKAAIRSLSGDKRTSLGHHRFVAFDRGCVKTPKWNLRIEFSSRLHQFEQQKRWRPLSGEDNRENNSAPSSRADVFTQPRPEADITEVSFAKRSRLVARSIVLDAVG
jgi:hypothetical protein